MAEDTTDEKAPATPEKVEVGFDSILVRKPYICNIGGENRSLEAGVVYPKKLFGKDWEKMAESCKTSKMLIGVNKKDMIKKNRAIADKDGNLYPIVEGLAHSEIQSLKGKPQVDLGKVEVDNT